MRKKRENGESKKIKGEIKKYGKVLQKETIAFEFWKESFIIKVMSIEHLDISSVIIREMRACDHNAAKALSKEMHETLRKVYRPSNSRPSINEGNTPFTRIVAAINEQVVGMATYEQDGDALYFGSLGVLDKYKKQGIARKLIQFIEEEAKKLGLPKLTCSTVLETGNEAIFHKLGFTTVEKQETSKFISITPKKIIHEVSLKKNLYKE